MVMAMKEFTTEFFDWIRDHASDDVAKLRLKYGKEYGGAITQIECRRKFGKKLEQTLTSFPDFYFPSVLAGEHSSTSQNVYLLSQVDENDLKEFVDQEKEPATVTPTPQVVIDENKTEETDKKEEIAKPEKEKMPQANMGAMAAILILALGGVAAYYYFKIYKPKKEEEEDFEEEGLETSDGLEIINEDEFEDREEENE